VFNEKQIGVETGCFGGEEGGRGEEGVNAKVNDLMRYIVKNSRLKVRQT
jgi:hypothetical protein